MICRFTERKVLGGGGEEKKKRKKNMKNGKWILAGPSSSFCSVITIPERFPRRAQQREKASSTVLKTLTNLRYKRRLSSDVNVGTSQPQLKSARSTFFNGRETIEDSGHFRTTSASCLETHANTSNVRIFGELREDNGAAFTPELRQYSEMDVDFIHSGGSRSNLDTTTV